MRIIFHIYFSNCLALASVPMEIIVQKQQVAIDVAIYSTACLDFIFFVHLQTWAINTVKMMILKLFFKVRKENYIFPLAAYHVCTTIEVNSGTRDEQGCSLIQLLTPASLCF